jgi:nicotinamidase-related amidase
MSRQAAAREPAEVVLLLCLDTLEIAASGSGFGAPPAWTAAAARLLAHARAQGWIVAHVLRRRPNDGSRWRPVEGLAPRPFERVFHRDRPSAYSSPEFAMLSAGEAEIVMVGRSTDGAFLATASDALARGMNIAIASDAVAAPLGERASLSAMAQRIRQGGEGALTIQNAVQLVAAAPRLRLLDGGAAQPRAMIGDGHDL